MLHRFTRRTLNFGFFFAFSIHAVVGIPLDLSEGILYLLQARISRASTEAFRTLRKPSWGIIGAL